MKTERIKKLRMEASYKDANGKHRTPVAYGYARVSHQNSFKKGDSLPAQEHRIKQYFKNNLEDTGVQFGGVQNDGVNVSAYSVPFAKRPAGMILMRQMEPGDHLILDKPDRLFRSTEDFYNTMKMFSDKQITVHIVNFLGQSLQNTTPLGDFVLSIFILIAELESAIKSERIKEGLQNYSRKHGYTCKPCFTPPGTYRVRQNTGFKEERYYLEWDVTERALMNEIVRIIDEERLGWKNSYTKIEAFAAKLYDRPIRPVADQKDDRRYYWPKLYKWETAYRYLKVEDPTKIPPKDIIYEAARQHRRERSERRYLEEGDKYYRGIFKSSIEKITREELLGIE